MHLLLLSMGLNGPVLSSRPDTKTKAYYSEEKWYVSDQIALEYYILFNSRMDTNFQRGPARFSAIVLVCICVWRVFLYAVQLF